MTIKYSVVQEGANRFIAVEYEDKSQGRSCSLRFSVEQFSKIITPVNGRQILLSLLQDKDCHKIESVITLLNHIQFVNTTLTAQQYSEQSKHGFILDQVDWSTLNEEDVSFVIATEKVISHVIGELKFDQLQMQTCQTMQLKEYDWWANSFLRIAADTQASPILVATSVSQVSQFSIFSAVTQVSVPYSAPQKLSAASSSTAPQGKKLKFAELAARSASGNNVPDADKTQITKDISGERGAAIHAVPLADRKRVSESISEENPEKIPLFAGVRGNYYNTF